VVFDEIMYHFIFANFGTVQGSGLMFRQDVAVSPVFQQEANHISIAPLTSLRGKNTTIRTQYITKVLSAKYMTAKAQLK